MRFLRKTYADVIRAALKKGVETGTLAAVGARYKGKFWSGLMRAKSVTVFPDLAVCLCCTCSGQEGRPEEEEGCEEEEGRAKEEEGHQEEGRHQGRCPRALTLCFFCPDLCADLSPHRAVCSSQKKKATKKKATKKKAPKKKAAKKATKKKAPKKKAAKKAPKKKAAPKKKKAAPKKKAAKKKK